MAVLKMKLNLKCFRNYITICKQRPTDGVAFTFLIFISLATYYYGTYEVLPHLLVGYPSILFVIACIVTTGNVTALLSNLYLIRMRDSTILNRMLMQPTMKTSSLNQNRPLHTDDDVIKEHTKILGQQFMATPFGEAENWHICAACEVFVPPRAWHCQHCKTCVIRRDHHCIFTMCCIGEENHSNFIGLLFYLAVGSTLATAVNVLYTLIFTITPLWLFILKAFIPFYTILFDFSIMNLLSGINFLGMGITWMLFAYYMILAFRSQTCADKTRGISRKVAGVAQHTYANISSFLGNYPFMRIVWPFHTPLKIDYGPTKQPETRKEL